MLNSFMGRSNGVSAPSSAAAGESASPSYHRIEIRQNVQDRDDPKRSRCHTAGPGVAREQTRLAELRQEN
jgi:hypothetical protein